MSGQSAIQYELPEQWIRYERMEIVDELTKAKAAVMSLSAMPFQRAWAEKLQEIELKREIAGTSKIEGADFTDRELNEALSKSVSGDGLTRSQRQARAASEAYRWIARIPLDAPINEGLIKDIHKHIVAGCDDDHCGPGELRHYGQNVGFGRPLHRGVEGGPDCEEAFKRLVAAFSQEFRGHDPLVQALALHYHLGAMHPFQDGNGRTARAVEALVLKRAQMKDTLFIAMSNYYYDEKDQYLGCLSEVRKRNYDLTPFLKFGLRGFALQCQRLLNEIRIHVEKSLYRDVMSKMYGRLRSPRKRALGDRQLEVLTKLLDLDHPIDYLEFYTAVQKRYKSLSASDRAYVRDLNNLSSLGAISVRKEEQKYFIAVRPEWATEITETSFYKYINNLPKAKTRLIVSE